MVYEHGNLIWTESAKLFIKQMRLSMMPNDTELSIGNVKLTIEQMSLLVRLNNAELATENA